MGRKAVNESSRRLAAGMTHSCSCSLWPTLGQKATETKEQWKDMKATYMDHVDVIKCALSEALPQVKEAHRKYTELQKAFEQLEAKKRVLEEKLQLAQKQWALQQKRLQNLTKMSAEVRKVYQVLWSWDYKWL